MFTQGPLGSARGCFENWESQINGAYYILEWPLKHLTHELVDLH